MEKISRTAKVLDKVFALLYWLMLFVMVFGVLCCAILAFLNAQGPGISDSVSANLSLGHYQLRLHPDAVPERYGDYMTALAVYSLLGLPVYCVMLLTVRDTLKPFIDRQPFHETVAKDLKKLAILVAINAILEQGGSFLLTNMVRKLFDPAALLKNDLILEVTTAYSLDLTPLLFALALYLLSKVFLYGQELQTLSDETL